MGAEHIGGRVASATGAAARCPHSVRGDPAQPQGGGAAYGGPERAEGRYPGPDMAELPKRRADDVVAIANDLPVVAQLVVEIRSDGVRTRARGAMVDVPSGQQVAIDVGAGSILELSSALAKAVLGLPMLLFKARRARGRTPG